jgi:hypothetical protein
MDIRLGDTFGRETKFMLSINGIAFSYIHTGILAV